MVSKGAAADSGIRWRQNWAGVSSVVGNGMAADFDRAQQQSQGWGGGGFRYGRWQQQIRVKGGGDGFG